MDRVVVVAIIAAGQLWGRGLDSFSFHGFGHFCLSLGHPSSSAFKGGACSWVGNWCRHIFWGEEEGKSMQPVLERVPLPFSLLHLYPS